MSRPVHFAMIGTGELTALCGYSIGVVGIGDPRRERFSTDELAVTCALCRAALDAATIEPAILQSDAWRPARMGSREAYPLREAEIVRPLAPTVVGLTIAAFHARDAGAPIRSTSDLERSPGPTGGPPEGDRAQRAAERYVPYWRAYGLCLALEQIVIELAIVGVRTERYPSGPAKQGGRDERRKQRLNGRTTDVDAVDEAMQRTCGLTLGQAEPHKRSGLRRIEGVLLPRGVVAVRADWLHAQEGVQEGVMGKLVGWSEIAAHVRKSEDTAQRAQRWDPPIPVHRVGSQVWADEADLDAWMRSQPKRSAVG